MLFHRRWQKASAYCLSSLYLLAQGNYSCVVKNQRRQEKQRLLEFSMAILHFGGLVQFSVLVFTTQITYTEAKM